MTAPASKTAPAARRPLIVRIRNWIGDVVLGIPALKLLEEHGYDLHVVARGKWAPALLAGHGWPVHVQPGKLADRVRQLKEVRATCRAIDPGFDRRENAVVFPTSFSSAMEMRLAGLKAVGYGYEGRSPLLKRAEPIFRGGHALISYWKLALRFLRIERDPPPLIGLQLPQAKVDQARRVLEAHGVKPGYLLICPFAGGLATAKKLNKKWPDFPEFVRRAHREYDWQIVVYPGPGEHEEARTLYPDAIRIDSADLLEYGAVLQGAALVVSNDTGPAHMAAALGSPLLSVLGPTFPEQWAPWGPKVRVVRKPQPETGTVWPTVDEVMPLARQMYEAPVPDAPLPTV